jgi:hypothetical protein
MHQSAKCAIHKACPLGGISPEVVHIDKQHSKKSGPPYGINCLQASTWVGWSRSFRDKCAGHSKPLILIAVIQPLIPVCLSGGCLCFNTRLGAFVAAILAVALYCDNDKPGNSFPKSNCNRSRNISIGQLSETVC